MAGLLELGFKDAKKDKPSSKGADRQAAVEDLVTALGLDPDQVDTAAVGKALDAFCASSDSDYDGG